MRRKGTSEQLAVERERGLVLLEQGKKPKEVAEMLNVTVRSVYRWCQESKKPKRKKIAMPLGRPRKINEKQVKRLEKALDQGAEAFGYGGDYWTLDRIAQVIWQLFQVRYHPSALSPKCGLVRDGAHGVEQPASTAPRISKERRSD